MNIEPYEPIAAKPDQELIELLRTHYGTDETADFFIDEYERAFAYCCTSEHVTFRPFRVVADGAMLGHISLICDDRLPAGQAFFGFLEFPNDSDMFELLWQELTDRARAAGVERLLGPVNGSVWHQYRCVKRTTDVSCFRTEPRTPTYYYKRLAAQGPAAEITYRSGIRRSYDALLAALRAQADGIAERLRSGGFDLSVRSDISPELLQSIALLSARVFAGKSWGYTKLEPAEFASLYDLERTNAHLYKVVLLHHGGTLVGYCSLMREGADLICKTIALAPEYQGQGLGSALALAIHEEAAQEGMERIRYVLVRDGNQVQQFPLDDVETFREYAAFEFEL